ncbi:MAG: cytochrome c [Nitrospirota bacterium]|jgi:mono/diheme cytochrome c family protein
MYQRSIALLFIVMLTTETALPVGAEKPEGHRQTQERGRHIYEQACLWCHGTEGRGDGPAGWAIGRYTAPRPRDFVSEGFKFRSTPSGELPSDHDLFRTVTRGIPGVMPSFGSLTEQERWEVITYIKTFNPAFKETPPIPLNIPIPSVPASEASVAQGRAIYLQFGCQGCHGENGTGDGAVHRAGELRDEHGLRIAPTDLTSRASFKNGSDLRDIYRTLMTGLDGTPMPSYAANFEGNEDNVWHVVNYLLSLSPGPSQ